MSTRGGRLPSGRADASRTRRRLLLAAGDLLSGGASFRLADVAARAGVSTATAYRYFASASAVTDAYVGGFLDDVEARVSQETGQPVGFERYCHVWVQAVLAWGPALTHLRSPEGFLSRRATQDGEVLRSLRDLEPALRRELPGLGDDELTYVIGVWNVLADPREVLDQADVLSWSAEAIAARLADTTRAATASGRSRASDDAAPPRPDQPDGRP